MADIVVDPWLWSTTAASNSPSGTTAVGTGLDDNLRAIQAAVKSQLEALNTVAGTNTITATSTGLTAYATGQRFAFIPANTNTAATTLNVTALGAKNVFWNGAACVGGELRQNVPCIVIYDGTQFNIIGNGFNAPFLDTYAVVEGSADSTKKVRLEVDGLTTATTRVITPPDRDLTLRDAAVLSTEQATTSGTSIDFTGIPTWATKIIVQLVGVSTNGSSNLLVQIGDSGGIETAGYSSGAVITNTPASVTSTAGYVITGSNASANTNTGTVTLTLENAAAFTWVATGIIGSTSNLNVSAGSKATSAALDRVRLTTVNGTDAFDAGAVNILYE